MWYSTNIINAEMSMCECLLHLCGATTVPTDLNEIRKGDRLYPEFIHMKKSIVFAGLVKTRNSSWHSHGRPILYK